MKLKQTNKTYIPNTSHSDIYVIGMGQNLRVSLLLVTFSNTRFI